MSRNPKRPKTPKNERDRDEYPWHNPENVRAAWEKHDSVADVGRHFGISSDTARRILERYTDYEPKEYGSHKLNDLNPEDVGLSPLGSAKPEVLTDGGTPHPDAGGD